MPKKFIMMVCAYMSLGLVCSADYPNIENQMLSNTLSNFMYYATQDPRGFSNPRSLRDTEKRARIIEQYHIENNIPSYYSPNNLYINNYQYNNSIFFYNKSLIFTIPNP